MKLIALAFLTASPLMVAQAGPYQDALKAAVKALSVTATEHDTYKNPIGHYVRRDVEVNFKLSESAHCELTIHRDAKVTYTAARALGAESPEPATFYEIPLKAMLKDIVQKNAKSNEQDVNAGSVTGNNTTTSKTFLVSEDTIVPLAGLDATGAKPNEISSIVPLRAPVYGDEKSANAAIATLAALAATCR